jgi:hypothetical protein
MAGNICPFLQGFYRHTHMQIDNEVNFFFVNSFNEELLAFHCIRMKE